MSNPFNFDKIIRDFPNEMEKISQEMANRTLHYFVVSYTGRVWNSVAWPVNKSKSKRTGALENALRNGVEHVGPDGFLIVVKRDYASYLNDGTQYIEQRKYVAKGENNEEEIQKIQIDVLNKGILDMFK